MSADQFEFFSVPRIVFGRGTIARLGEIAGPLGSRCVMIFNGDERLMEKVSDALLHSSYFVKPVRQRGEPTVADVDRAVSSARECNAEFVVGLGGGSAIDAAKAVAG